MNKLAFVLIFLLCSSHAALTYSVDVDRSGISSVTLSMENEQEAQVFIPKDARNFRIVGATYSIVNDTAAIKAGKSGFATFSFLSDSLTSKTGSGWKLTFSSPEGAEVTVYMPPYATIEGSSPRPSRIIADESRAQIGIDGGGNVTVSYMLDEVPMPAAENDVLFPAILAVLLLAIIVAWFMLKGKKESSPSLNLTAGKKEMMETFNENDMVIVKFLLDNGGKTMRNVLERRTSISKSSLAMALNRLEKRRIIEMDRTATTHFVKLSDYFLRL